MSEKPSNDWEITSIQFGSLPPLGGSDIRTRFIESMYVGNNLPKLLPADGAAKEERPNRPSVDEDYFGP